MIELKRLAALGAQIRLQQIHQELVQLELFLGLRMPKPVVRRRRMHWTQRPENAVKLANARLRAVLTRRKAKKAA